MADSEYPYPPDQFDAEAETSSFHGAHRAEEPFWRQNLLYLAIIGASVLTLLALLLVVGGMKGTGASDGPTSAAPQQTTTQPASDGGGTTAPAAQPDQTTPVLVINASGKKGLAGEWRDKLTGEGWTQVQVQTAQNRQQAAVVYYRDDADAATAQALATAVGVEKAQQSDDYDARITFLAVDSPQG